MNTRRIVTATLGCVVFASVAAFVGVTKAEAYTWSGYGGSTGAVSVPVTVGHSGNPYASSGGPGPDPYLETGVLRVYRSPASSTGRQ